MTNPQARQEAGVGPRGSYMGEHTARNARWAFVGWLSYRAAVRHYEATGDWELAARSGARAVVRWWCFWTFGIVFNLGVAFWLLLTVPVWVNIATHAPVEAMNSQAYQAAQASVPTQSHVLMTVIGIACAVGAYLLSTPYTLGVLWVRNSDRSLHRVNRWRVYRWLLPFAWRMRSWPDGLLYLLPLAFVGAGWYLGQGLGWAIAWIV